MKLIRHVVIFASALAILLAQATPSLAKSDKRKSVRQEALVLLTKERLDYYKRTDRKFAKAYEAAKRNGTKVVVSPKLAAQMMKESAKNTAAVSGTGSGAAALPTILVAVPIVYKFVTNRDFFQDFSALGIIACIAAWWNPESAMVCDAYLRRLGTSPAGGIGIQPTPWWKRWPFAL